MSAAEASRRPTLLGLADAGALLAILASLAAWAPEVDGRFEFPGHARLHLGASLLLAAAVAARARRRRAAVYVLVAVVDLFPVAVRAWVPPRMAEPGEATLRVAYHNVNARNVRRAEAVAALAATDADIVAVLEASRAWLEELTVALPDHVHSLAHPQEDNFGLALFSRVPLEEAEVLWFDSSPPAMTARLRLGARTLTLLLVHPPPPVWTSARFRERQFAAIGNHAAEIEGPLVVFGDLNATPWTPRVERLREVAGLVDGGAGHGYGATWPAVLGPVGIPIDQVLVRGVGVTEFEVGEANGSDHRSLSFTLAGIRCRTLSTR